MILLFLHIMYFDLFHVLVTFCIPNYCTLIARRKKIQMYIKEDNSHRLESISKGQALHWTLCVHNLQPLTTHLQGRCLQAGKPGVTELT